MRPVIYLIIVAAAAYLGYNFYMERIATGAGENGTPAADGEMDSTTDAAGEKIPVFKSKIVIPTGGAPNEKHLAKPGIYYVLERTSIEHATGIAAVVPGEEVTLISRKGNGVMKVKSGKYEFELKESQLSNDLDVAQKAERNFALTHPPPRK